MSKKADLDTLNNLHSMVAKQLASNLDDPKILAMAIRFLKDNNIEADIIESESMMSITESIKQLAKEAKESPLSIEDLMDMH